MIRGAADPQEAEGLWSEEAGNEDAPLIALVHGSLDRSAGMLRLSRRLDRRFRVLRYDRRGYGKSSNSRGSGHPDEFRMTHQVDDLLSLLAGRPTLIVGHSYGGNVALAAAAQERHLVRGVVVYETPMSWEPWWPAGTAGGEAVSSVRAATNGVATGPFPDELPADATGDATDAVRADAAGDAAERFLRRMIGDEHWESLPERIRDMRRAEGAALVGELSDLQQRRPWQPAAINVPVVAGFGERGAAHHRLGMERMAAMLPDARLVELEGCRHDAPLSHADLFAREMVEPLLERLGEPWATPPVR